ncbi:MAG: sigma-70 family RNA polymerase sigma factor [Bacteroidales bacterium]
MEKHVLADHELIQKFVAGDVSALEALINRHRQKVYSYILMLVRKPQLAEDIFQDTFIKVIQSLHKEKYQDNGRFLSWVIRIAHNLIIDHYRKEKQMKTVSNDDYESDLFNSKRFADQTVEETLVHTQICDDVRNLIEYLPEDQKQVILLRHYAGLSFKEIAEQTNVSINTALGRMRYALINLRKLIAENNITLSKA